MRLLKVFVPTLVVLMTTLAPVLALPVPKLPAEAKNKPSLVVRVRPVGELLKDASYLAKLVQQNEVFDALKSGIEPVIDSLDGTKPIGFYAKIGANGIDSHGVLMLPVKNLKDFTATLALLGVNATEGQGGLYSVNVPGSPFGVIFRHVGGYVYATVKNTPDAEPGLAADKVYTPEVLFKQGDDSLFSLTVNVDAIPNDLKSKGLKGLEEGLNELRRNEITKIADPVLRGVAESVAEEIATKMQLLVTDTQSTIFRIDLDRTKEDVGLSVKVTPRASSDLAAEFAVIGGGKSIAAGVIAPNGVGSFSANISAPASVKKAIDSVYDKFVDGLLQKQNENERPLVKEFYEILGPTVKAGVLDFAADFRGPDSDARLTMLAAVQVKDAAKLEAFLRRVHGMLPAGDRDKVKVDAAKSGGIAIHEITAPLDPGLRELFGENGKAAFAFRKDSLFLGFGPGTEAVAAIKSAVDSTAKASPIVEGIASMRKLAPLIERKDPGAIASAKKAYPAGIDDAIRIAVTGGESLDIRFTTSARLIQFGVLQEQAKRGR